MVREDAEVYKKMLEKSREFGGRTEKRAKEMVDVMLEVQGKLPPEHTLFPEISKPPWLIGCDLHTLWADGYQICDVINNTEVNMHNLKLFAVAPNLMHQVYEDRKLLEMYKDSALMNSPRFKAERESLKKSLVLLKAAGVNMD